LTPKKIELENKSTLSKSQANTTDFFLGIELEFMIGEEEDVSEQHHHHE